MVYDRQFGASYSTQGIVIDRIHVTIVLKLVQKIITKL